MNRGVPLGGAAGSSSGASVGQRAQQPPSRRGNQGICSSSSGAVASPKGRRHPSGSGNGELRGPSVAAQASAAAAAAMVNAIYSGSSDEDLPKIKPLWPNNGTVPQQQPLEWEWQRERERERPDPEKKPRLVKVRLSVHYRVHSRQMLCIGGSQIPFGWSFLSIAKVPMTWLQGDVWQAEVLLPAGQRIEYKYVILEEQDWTKLENEDAEGLVEVSYRSGTEPGKPPDVQVIQKQMAIVAWQPGPNRIVQVPTEEELGALSPGDVVERVPARPPARSALEAAPSGPDPFEGTWEALEMGEEGSPLLDRHDVWGWTPPSSTRPQSLRNLRFDN